jgi:hypothetical protein
LTCFFGFPRFECCAAAACAACACACAQRGHWCSTCQSIASNPELKFRRSGIRFKKEWLEVRILFHPLTLIIDHG